MPQQTSIALCCKLFPCFVTLWVASLSGIPSAIAQEQQGCFFVDSSGRAVSLGGICNGDSPSRRVYQARIKRRLGGIPVIDVTFNGNQTFEMIVDTGASGSLITASMAQALRVVPTRVEISAIADGSRVIFPVGYVQSIGVGGAVVRNVPVAIAERMDIGLLGHDFFGDYDVTIRRDVVEFRR
ncbi:retroviral-like aspartic protease family protein [Desertifilum sp. FACHB-1129]|uniref:Aspartyl protease n=1 Tax=Desertifilum tharense IPPAS B-1220 TaxID=1781255 RepID=A0A1E5QE26_9CYAN|nr:MULTISPECIES: retropepsin-like aspartic protease [Desertifilum]MDA0211676.1 retropepsin-like aspartic protease [Cyanobacteria bacterium FC1]MBD2312183.1 retroviral-like aspartic protease family protein [Desertifilum sp. FACHB-1129]MBD2322155.1 retroviral-like aspartic protease family protein [Desertifilum sp. FACHB-866]MBD2332192.1 retroviral-like aspartic protease family protein [Desertifilum sp. FACHB-868]OEJ72908.1 hypothetical protein BH720_22500 [Desertifilum tharense IPPAS B-1220]